MAINPVTTMLEKLGTLKSFVLPVVILLTYFQTVDSKRCTHEYETGLIKEFYCGPYEYCCGTQCCRASRSMGFFQLWYFWLLIMLMMLLCSGGGWWARYRRNYSMEATNYGYPTAIPPLRTGGPTYNTPSATTFSPPPYMPNNFVAPNLMPLYAAQGNGLSVHLPQQMQNSASTPVSYPPPTYLGPPPPSYAVATGQNPT